MNIDDRFGKLSRELFVSSRVGCQGFPTWMYVLYMHVFKQAC